MDPDEGNRNDALRDTVTRHDVLITVIRDEGANTRKSLEQVHADISRISKDLSTLSAQVSGFTTIHSRPCSGLLELKSYTESRFDQHDAEADRTLARYGALLKFICVVVSVLGFVLGYTTLIRG